MQIKRLWRDSSAFRLAEDFGIIAEIGNTVVFWFEKCRAATVDELLGVAALKEVAK